MSRLSVPEAAGRLNVSPARIRQRIDNGSLAAEKIGGRWLVDLAASQAVSARVGRPVSPSSVWWSLAAAEIAQAAAFGSASIERGLLPRMRAAEAVLATRALVADPPGGHASVQPHRPWIDLIAKVGQPSRSSRNRAVQRLAQTVASRDHEALLAWLGNRASRRVFVAAPGDLDNLRADERLEISGVSHRASGMEDPRVVEGYVASDEVDAVVADYWLERPSVDDRPNVVLHVSPVRPPAIGDALLAADLAEHLGPREVARAHELLDNWLDAVSLPDTGGDPQA